MTSFPFICCFVFVLCIQLASLVLYGKPIELHVVNKLQFSNYSYNEEYFLRVTDSIEAWVTTETSY